MVCTGNNNVTVDIERRSLNKRKITHLRFSNEEDPYKHVFNIKRRGVGQKSDDLKNYLFTLRHR